MGNLELAAARPEDIENFRKKFIPYAFPRRQNQKPGRVEQVLDAILDKSMRRGKPISVDELITTVYGSRSRVSETAVRRVAKEIRDKIAAYYRDSEPGGGASETVKLWLESSGRHVADRDVIGSGYLIVYDERTSPPAVEEETTQTVEVDDIANKLTTVPLIEENESVKILTERNSEVWGEVYNALRNAKEIRVLTTTFIDWEHPMRQIFQTALESGAHIQIVMMSPNGTRSLLYALFGLSDRYNLSYFSSLKLRSRLDEQLDEMAAMHRSLGETAPGTIEVVVSRAMPFAHFFQADDRIFLSHLLPVTSFTSSPMIEMNVNSTFGQTLLENWEAYWFDVDAKQVVPRDELLLLYRWFIQINLGWNGLRKYYQKYESRFGSIQEK